MPSVTPDILSATPSYFNSGASFPSGIYVVAYSGGSFDLNFSGSNWCATAISSVSHAEYHVTDGAGNDVAFVPVNPGVLYATAIAAETGDAGRTVTYPHTGGKIGVYLQDSPYDDNNADPINGPPVFSLIQPASVTSFTATWTQTCLSRNQIILAWSVINASSVSIDHGIGVVASSGTLTVTYDGNPTYTITAVGATGTISQQVTAVPTFPANMITLPTANATPVYFNSKANYAAGLYLITCCGGAFSWDGAKLGINANDRHIPSSQAFKVFGSQGNQIDAPGNYPGYSSVAASDTANQGLTQFFNHAGGPVGIFLNLDDYSRAYTSFEPPAFSISGPAPYLSLTANATPVLAGTSVTLTWAVTGSVDTVTIDHGIGSVSASGSQAVSVTTTTRYTLTAVYQGITVTTYADVLVGAPTVPVVVFTPNCGGTINIAWAIPSYTANTLIERSATGGGVGFSQIASVAYPVHVSIETPPSPGVTFWYRLRTTDGTNFSAYSQEQAAASLVVPPAVTLSSYLDGRGVPVLTWTANTTATSYLLKRGTISGQETTLYTLAVTTPGQGFIIKDPSASVGVLTYYVVAGVNSCGTGAVSNEVSMNPGTANPYQTATSWTT